MTQKKHEKGAPWTSKHEEILIYTHTYMHIHMVSLLPYIISHHYHPYVIAKTYSENLRKKNQYVPNRVFILIAILSLNYRKQKSYCLYDIVCRISGVENHALHGTLNYRINFNSQGKRFKI